MKKAILFTIFTFCLLPFTFYSQTLAPGGPGKDAQWASAGKQGVGTSASLESKVWFTLQGGALTEVYYPNVAVGNVHLLQFVVVNPKTKKVETERDDATHEINVLRPDSLTFQQINTAKSGEWKITKTYATDVERDSVLIDVEFEAENRDLNIYLYYDPSLSNSGMQDTGWTKDDALLAEDKKVASAIVTNPPIWGEGKIFSGNDKVGEPYYETSSGFYGVSDGLTELRKNDGSHYKSYYKAEKGNVVQVAPIRRNTKAKQVDDLNVAFVQKKTNFTISLGFGETTDKALQSANSSLKKGFKNIKKEYEKGWSDYVKTLRKVDPKYQAQFNMAAMILKAHEDKIHRGANIASLSVPWGGGDNANEDNVGGYHLVWSRDLYQVFTAYMALGDRAAAERALDFLLKVQQKPDGSFPQNSWLDGKPFWGSLQMDEVAYPLIMAYQLKRFDKETYTKHLKPAADFIVKNGPSTPQERWEEEGGYSPSTIAAEIAGLVCVAEIAKKNGDMESATKYLKTADEWQANIEKWTATTTGKYGDGNYYLRITQNGKPDAGDKIELNNGAGFFDEREIVDAGFLELVRLGIKPADDPLIQKSVKVIDEVIKVNTPNGEAFYRYNHDGYGEMDDGRRWNWDGKYTGKGRLWVLLSGERGQYELALQNLNREKLNALLSKSGRNGTEQKIDLSDVMISTSREIDNSNKTSKNYQIPNPSSRLDAMQKFANNGLMIPEQVWDKKEVPEADSQFSPNLQFGEGTGSATPLAWSMAQFIRLAVNLQEGKNLDTPDVVYERYVLGKKRGKEELTQSNGEISSSVTIDDIKELQSSCEQRFNLLSLLQLTNAPKISPKDWKPPVIPEINKTSAKFFHKENGKEIEVVGDFTNWKSQNLKMKQVLQTDWKCFELKFPSNARIEYKLIIDGKWITDPLNPNKIDNGVGGENSVLEMPDYKPSESAIKKNSDKYIVQGVEIESKKYGNRKVQIYFPKGFGTDGVSEKLPVLYLQDGTEYMNRANAIIVLENLIAVKKIKPHILVFVDPKDRMKEYWANDDWANFMANEVVPTVEKRFPNKIKTGRENRALIGASLGGITSIWTALKYPNVFAKVAGQSSSFWVDDERVVKELAKLKGDEKFNFYIDDGIFEGVEDSRKVVNLLRNKDFDVTYIEGQTGHNWTSWRDRLADAFVALMN